MKKLFFIVVISSIVAACAVKPFAPTEQELSTMRQKVPGLTMESAKAGSKLYAEKCAGCHQLYRPDKYTIAQWDNILPKMFSKAKLSGEAQRKLIEDYVRALSK